MEKNSSGEGEWEQRLCVDLGEDLELDWEVSKRETFLAKSHEPSI
jgi:hypothetical protein